MINISFGGKKINQFLKISIVSILFNCKNSLHYKSKSLEERAFYSIYEQDFEKFRKYFENLKNKNSVDTLGNNLLHIAIERNLKVFYNYLLDNGVSCFVFNKKNKLPEDLTEDIELKEKLKNIRNLEALLISMKEGNLEDVKLYSSKLKNIENLNILNICIENMKNSLDFKIFDEIFQCILEQHHYLVDRIKTNKQLLYNSSQEQETPLYKAVGLAKENKKFIKIIKSLIEKGADRLIGNQYRDSAIRLALSSREHELIDIFLDNIDEKLKKKISFFKEKLIDIVNKNSLEPNYEEAYKNLYNLISYFLDLDMEFILKQEEYIDILILSFLLPNDFLLFPTTKNVCEENRNLYSNYKMYDLGAWVSLIDKQDVPILHKDKIELQQRLVRLEYQVTSHLLKDAIDIIDSSAENNNIKIENDFHKLPFFKDDKGQVDSYGAEMAREKLQKISSLLQQMENKNLSKGLMIIITRLATAASVCSVGFSEELTNILIDCLGGLDEHLNNNVGLRIYKANECILESAISKYNEGKNKYTKIDYNDAEHHMLYIRKNVGLLNSRNIDGSGEYTGESLKKATEEIKKFFKNEYTKIIKEEIKAGFDINKTTFSYFSKITDCVNDLAEIIYDENVKNSVKEKIALATLIHKGYVSFKNEDGSD